MSVVSPDPLGDKVIFLRRQLKSCQLIHQQHKDKCVLTWLLFPGAQSVLLLTEKVALIIEHTADTAPLMLNIKTMRSWSAPPADMRSTDADNSFLNDRIFNEGTASEISSINKSYYSFSQDFPKQNIPLLRLTDKWRASTYPPVFKTKQQGSNWWMNAQRTRAPSDNEGLPGDLASSGITFKLQHNASTPV